MAQYPEQIKNLIEYLQKLPGLGPKSAERIVFHLLKSTNQSINKFINDLEGLKKQVVFCSQCFNISTTDPCPFCSDKSRNHQQICVVSEPQDVIAIEKTGEYHGLYHVLGGVLNPAIKNTPDKLRISELLARVTKKGIKEIIIATNPDLEGESTALYLQRHLKKMNIKTTRLGKGLPMGATLEYADEITVSNALKNRQQL